MSASRRQAAQHEALPPGARDTEGRALVLGAVYLVTTTEDESIVGAYAGTERGRLVFSSGVLSPLWFPADKVREATRIG